MKILLSLQLSNNIKKNHEKLSCNTWGAEIKFLR